MFAVGWAVFVAADDLTVVSTMLRPIVTDMGLTLPDGLDDAAWKGQTCSTCHQWTKEALCDQGKFYVKEGEARTQSKQHPLGGAFKLALFRWAQADCP